MSKKLWAFYMMQAAHASLKSQQGLEFYKLMGSGKTLGSPRADWSTYALLQVWTNEHYAHDFFESSSLYARYKKQSDRQLTFYLIAFKSHGTWNGKKVFDIAANQNIEGQNIAVITRATISFRYLIRFWKQALEADHATFKSQGLSFAKGIGEVPIRNMATFSIWKTSNELADYAYKKEAHKKAIRMTKQLNWYKEECFTRFIISKQSGNISDFSE